MVRENAVEILKEDTAMNVKRMQYGRNRKEARMKMTLTSAVSEGLTAYDDYEGTDGIQLSVIMFIL